MSKVSAGWVFRFLVNLHKQQHVNILLSGLMRKDTNYEFDFN
jgi:hypothetical protein